MKTLVSVILILFGIEDIRTQNISFWPLIALLILSATYGMMHFPLVQCVLGVLPGIILLLFAWLQKGTIGIGDGLIAVVYGIFYGWRKTCVWLMFSFFLAAVIGLFWKMITKRRKLRLPFIPFMAVIHMGMSL